MAGIVWFLAAKSGRRDAFLLPPLVEVRGRGESTTGSSHSTLQTAMATQDTSSVSADASLEDRLKQMSLKPQSNASDNSSTPLDAEAILAAFRGVEGDTDRNQALAAIALSQRAQSGEQVGKSLLGALSTSLQGDDAKDTDAALRLLVTLYAIAPQQAHDLLLSHSLISAVLPRIKSDEDQSNDLFRAEVLSAAAGHVASRTALKGNVDVQRWLDTASRRNDGAISLVAQLAMYKLQRGPTESDQAGVPTAISTQLPLHDLEDRLLQSARTQILDAACPRSTTLLALEAVGYLSATPRLKEAITNDGTFLRALCALPQRDGAAATKKSVFPPRAGSGSTTNPLPLPQDTSLQYGLSMIIFNLVALKPLLTPEQKQMRKLKAMASAQQGGQGTSQDAHSDDDPLEDDAASHRRGDRVIEAGGVRALVSVAASGSKAVRATVGQALLSLTTKQDRIRRGKIAQEGGGKILLAFSVGVSRDLMSGGGASGGAAASAPFASSNDDDASASSFAPLHALAQLCITTSPAILFGSPSGAIAALPSLATLYIHPSTRSNPLRRFEALLALTNVASLSGESAEAVVKARCGDTTVAQAMEDSILLEDNGMIRRAAVELLCNTAGVESVLKRWSGEEQAGDGGGGGEAAQTRLHLLVALCAATGDSLALRLAASASLSILCGSPAACRHVLSLKPKTLNIIARLLHGATRGGGGHNPKIREITDNDDEDEDEEEDQEERRLSTMDLESSPSGVQHAKASLAIRALAIVDCLLQYLQWRRSSKELEWKREWQTLLESGIHNAMDAVVDEVTQDLRQFVEEQRRGAQGQGQGQGQADIELRGMQQEIVKMGRGCQGVVRQLRSA